MREYGEASKEYWDDKWSFGEGKREHCVLDGSDGEDEFDRELLKKTLGKDVLDLGCGSGVFTLKIAKRARYVAGIDLSPIALQQALRNLRRSKLRNVEFRHARANRLPYPEATFDIVYSRRGPGSDSSRTIRETYRTLRQNGTFMEITIGERDKQNIARIFGRGQMLNVRGQVSDKKKMMLEKAGFTRVVSRDYLGTEIFRGMSDLLVRLRSAPIIPAFDPSRDRKFLKRVQSECRTERGFETPIHRVVLVGRSRVRADAVRRNRTS